MISQEDRFLAQYLLSTKVHRLGDNVQGKMYEAYGNEMMRWRLKWLIQQEEQPNALADILCINSTPYRNASTILTIRLAMPVSTATPERGFNLMRRVKTYLTVTMRTESSSALALLHVHKNTATNGEAVAHEFWGEKNTMLNFRFHKADLRYLLGIQSSRPGVYIIIRCTAKN